MSRVLESIIAFSIFILSSAAQTLLSSPTHLRTGSEAEWAIFEGAKVDGTNLVLTFDAPDSSGEQTLFIRQDDVKQDWAVKLNEKVLGKLFLMEAPLVQTLRVPAGLLKEQGNRLEISGKAPDDILINGVDIEKGAEAEILERASIEVEVRDDRGEPLPGRVTIVNARGELAALDDFGATHLAVRPGVVYTANGRARVGVLPGEYTVYASRGPEYGVGRAKVSVSREAELKLILRREVDTRGWIASDTHIHTLTLSKHGDATLAERAITIAGEGIEMPVVTEHNQHATYGSVPANLGVARRFTPVLGNEVTTKKGHFNIFPVSLSAPPPDATIEEWPKLFEQIRAMPEVQVSIINHPTDVHSGFVPFAGTNLNLVTGKNLRGDFDFRFDGMEVINSGAMNSDWMAPFRAWFALLNRGYRIAAVAASDSHDVSRFIVGQGRTYIRGDDSKPGEIDIGEACANLKAGHAVVSLGLFATLSIQGGSANAGPGDLLKSRGEPLELRAHVSAPDWMTVTNVAIYANGSIWTNLPVRGAGEYSFAVPRLKQDTAFVLIAHGPGVTNQFWALARPYQPTSKLWEPVVIGATNPVWVDADGDGKFSSPREYAERLVQGPVEQTLQALADYDWAVAAQTAELLQLQGIELRPLIRTSLPKQVARGLEDYQAAAAK